MKIKCEYPDCKKEGVRKHTLNLINEEGASVELPFCEYHHLIVIGGHFKAKIIKECQNLLGEKRGVSFEILGPLKEVEIVEQIIGAREMIKIIKEKEKVVKTDE